MKILFIKYLSSTVFIFACQLFQGQAIELGLMYKALHYLCKQPDYYTFISLLKIIMLTLFAKSSASKHVREILRYLIHHICVLSPKEAHESFYRQFVNLRSDI